MQLRLFVALLVCISVCSGWEFTGNNISTKIIKDNGWTYKETFSFPVDIPLLWLGGNFLAGEVTSTGLAGSVDIVAASAYVVAGGFPAAYLAYFEADWNATTPSNGQDFASVNVAAAAGYMGTAVLWLEERDPNGVLITTHSLQWILNIGTDKGLSYTLEEASQQGDDIKYVTFSGKSNDEDTPNFSFDITYLASSRAGIVGGGNVQDVVVVPGSVESIVQITNFPYTSTNNTVSLVIAVATGNAQYSLSGQTVYDTDKTVYFSLNKNAYVGGNKVAVNISGYADATFDDVDNANLQQQVTQKYGAQAAIQLVRITFPPGASSIAYDPTIGTGNSYEDASGSSSLVSPFLSVVLFLSAFLLL